MKVDAVKTKILLMAVYSPTMLLAYEEVGICSIAAVLRQAGYEVRLIMQYEKNISYKEIVKFNPAVVGFTTYNANISEVNRVSNQLREFLPNALLCLGGNEATLNGNCLLRDMRQIDFIIIGEGERTFLNVVTAIDKNDDFSKIPGTIVRCGENIIHNGPAELISDLDLLPPIARDFLLQNNIKVVQISSSRGCMGNCAFCASNVFWRKWRGRSVKLVIDEIEDIYHKYKLDTFYFIDGSFEDPDPNCSRMTEIAQEIINRRIPIYYMALFRADFCRKATPKLMELLKRSGLFTAFVGIEAANKDDLKLYNKRNTVSDSHESIKLFERYNIGLQIGFISTNPYSTTENVLANIDFLEKYSYLNRFTTYEMYQGTSLHLKICTDGLENKNKLLGYEYKDSNVEKTVNYINEYIDSRLELKILYNDVNNIKNYMVFIFPQILSRCEKNEYWNVQPMLDQYKKEQCTLLAQINSIIGKWMKSALYFSKSFIEFQNHSDVYWSGSDIGDKVQKMKNKTNHFNRELAHMNLPFIERLQNFVI